jgi:hypothetical protein
MQREPSHSALSLTIFKAATGQTSTQAPHPMQVSLSILTAILGLLNVFFYYFICSVSVKQNIWGSILPLAKYRMRAT